MKSNLQGVGLVEILHHTRSTKKLFEPLRSLRLGLQRFKGPRFKGSDSLKLIEAVDPGGKCAINVNSRMQKIDLPELLIFNESDPLKIDPLKILENYVVGGVMEDECKQLLQMFFKLKREMNKR